jgi:hypothetical protein
VFILVKMIEYVGMLLPSFLAGVIGTIDEPPGVDLFNAKTGVADGIGIVIFVSNAIRLFTVIAGVWVMINFLIAGYDYITSKGDASAHTKVRDRITMSVIGLVLIVGSYTIVGVISFLFFGDPGFILNPEITGP